MTIRCLEACTKQPYIGSVGCRALRYCLSLEPTSSCLTYLCTPSWLFPHAGYRCHLFGRKFPLLSHRATFSLAAACPPRGLGLGPWCQDV